MLIISPEQGANRNVFSIFFNMKVYCVFSLESPHRGDSYEYTQYTTFVIRKKIIPDYPKSAAMGFFLETQDRFRNNRSTRAISVRATEVLLYIVVKGRKKDTNAFNHMVINGHKGNTNINNHVVIKGHKRDTNIYASDPLVATDNHTG